MMELLIPALKAMFASQAAPAAMGAGMSMMDGSTGFSLGAQGAGASGGLNALFSSVASNMPGYLKNQQQIASQGMQKGMSPMQAPQMQMGGMMPWMQPRLPQNLSGLMIPPQNRY